MPMIPLVDVKAQYAPLIPELKERLGEVLESGRFILGPNVTAFEEEAAAYLGVPATIGVGERHRRDRARPRGDGDRARRRGDLPVVHVLRDRRGDRPGAARRPSSPTSTPSRSTSTRRTWRRGSRRGRRRSCRCTCSAGPAPLAELAALGVPIVEDAAQAFGAAGDRHDRRRLDVQLLPDEEPVRARRRRPRRRHRHRARRPRADAALPRLARQEGLRARRLQLAPRRDPGRRAAPLPAAARRLERARAARQPRDTRSSASASSASCRPTSRATSTTCTSSARPSATGSREALTAAEISCASYYVTPLHLQPALRFLGWERRVAARDRARRGENLALPMWAGIDERDAGAGGRASSARRRRGGGVADAPAGQPAPPLAARGRRGAGRGRVVPRVPAALRPDRSRPTTTRSSTGRSGS